MRKVIISVISLVGLCLLVLLLNVTTPISAGPFGVLLFFVLTYSVLFGVVTFFVYLLSNLISHLSSVFMARRPLEALNLERASYLATILSAAPIILLGLQSVGRIGLYEYTLVILFVLIGCFYIYKKVIKN